MGLKEKMRLVRNVFLTHREMGQSEACRDLSAWRVRHKMSHNDGYQTIVIFRSASRDWSMLILWLALAPNLAINAVIGKNVKNAGMFKNPMLKGKFAFK